MEVSGQRRFEIGDASCTGDVRRAAVELARSLTFGENDAGRVGIVVTEAASNLVKHGGGGELLLCQLRHDGVHGIGILALDRGRGIPNVAAAMRDGFSQAGSPGTGLGAMRRLSTVFDVYSSPGVGTAVLSAIWPTRPGAARGMAFGGVNVPHPHEEVSGDAWAVRVGPDRTAVLVADGLGHGPMAAQASGIAVDVFHKYAILAPGELLTRIHAALRPTRGAAAAVAEVDTTAATVRFAGIGNIAATIVAGNATRSLVSHHGTLGHDVRRIQELSYPWEKDALLVIASDGLVSHWTLGRYPGLAARNPMLTAGVLYRDFRRGVDDASVVVVREAA